MYYPNHIEDICYEMPHINKVLNEIRKNIPDYFTRYIESEAGESVLDDDIALLAKKFGSSSLPKKKPKNYSKILKEIRDEAIRSFESDREIYLEIFNEEALEEYGHDVSSFKNTVLRNEVPIIRKTLQNKAAKELDKYRQAFKESQPGNLYSVCKNLVGIANEWKNDWYNPKEFETISDIKDLEYDDLDEEGYVVFGVIGGGIKSTFIYKLFPYMFPVRSREATWALWYLSAKNKFDCKEDSEFLMINKEQITTQQNYFYPYAIFSFYAHQIFLELKKLYIKYNVEIPTDYRFVIVEDFLSFVASFNQNEINLLKQNNKDYRYDD